MKHSLVKLAHATDWRFLEQEFGAVYQEGSGRPPLPTRLMTGLAILKHTFNLSDEELSELWLENRPSRPIDMIDAMPRRRDAPSTRRTSP
jgi:transposase, IS5 family